MTLSPSPAARKKDASGEHAGCELAVIIPAYNECDGIEDGLKELSAALARSDITHEILVVDDGSTDGTGDIAEKLGASVLRLGVNRGYGAALRAGILHTRSDYVAITDADGTYPGERLPELLEIARDFDMVVGARKKDAEGIPLIRRLPKRFLTRLASYLAGTKIPDLNSGLRVFRRGPLERFLPILPSGFSFTTTITLAMLCTEHRVNYVPIEYRKRIGSSKIQPFDFFRFIILVIRAILLFNPFKVFLPLGAVFFVGGLAKLGYDIYKWNLSETAVMGFLAAVILWAVGSLGDMISRLQLGSPRA